MDDNIAIIKRLAKLKQSTFREDELETMGIKYDARNDLVRKGLLKFDKSKHYPQGYYLTDSAYGLVQAKEIGEEGNTIAKKNTWLQIITIVISVIALIVAVLAYSK